MSFEDLLTQRVTIKRETDELLAATTILATHTLTYQPSEEATLHIVLAGCADGTGTVNIIGTVSGVSVTETLTFTGNGFEETINEFTEVAAITTTRLIDEATVGTLAVKARTAAGAPLYQEVTIESSRKMRIRARSGSIRIMQAGQKEVVNYEGYCETGTDIQAKDFVYPSGTSDKYIADFINSVRGQSAVHHKEVDLRKVA